MSTERGCYIVIEGNDGTGKSTQVRLLGDYLAYKGHEVVIVEEPGSDDPDKSTPVANELRRVIKDGRLQRAPEINLALFSAARRELWQQKIAPGLGRGAFVLAARNYISTLAYQGTGEGVSQEEIIRQTALFTDERYMHPDHLVILDLASEDERTRRIQERGELEAPDTFESKDPQFQARVNTAYHQIASARGLPIIDCIDRSHHRKTPDEIQAEIRQLLGL